MFLPSPSPLRPPRSGRPALGARAPIRLVPRECGCRAWVWALSGRRRSGDAWTACDGELLLDAMLRTPAQGSGAAAACRRRRRVSPGRRGPAPAGSSYPAPGREPPSVPHWLRGGWEVSDPRGCTEVEWVVVVGAWSGGAFQGKSWRSVWGVASAACERDSRWARCHAGRESREAACLGSWGQPPEKGRWSRRIHGSRSTPCVELRFIAEGGSSSVFDFCLWH